jgi:hypothetical protein
VLVVSLAAGVMLVFAIVAAVIIKAYPGSDDRTDFIDQSGNPITWEALSRHFECQVTAVAQYAHKDDDEPVQGWAKSKAQPKLNLKEQHGLFFAAFPTSKQLCSCAALGLFCCLDIPL